MRVRLLAETIGTAALLATVVGAGIMGTQLGAGNLGVALAICAATTAAMLAVLIPMFMKLSGAHFNPLVTLAMRLRGDMSTSEACGYALAQVFGAFLGVCLAHAMFGQPLLQIGVHARTGSQLWLSEGVATAGLLLTILLALRHRPAAVGWVVPLYVFAGYWFTASSCFANPALTLARAFTATFAGLRLVDVPDYMLAQCAGLGIALMLDRALHPSGVPSRRISSIALSTQR